MRFRQASAGRRAALRAAPPALCIASPANTRRHRQRIISRKHRFRAIQMPPNPGMVFLESQVRPFTRQGKGWLFGRWERIHGNESGLQTPQKGRIERTMEVTLPLEKMTTAEKLRVMETLWRDLTRDEEQFESPAWHGEVLRERVKRVKQGKETFIDWETAKRQLRNRVK